MCNPSAFVIASIFAALITLQGSTGLAGNVKLLTAPLHPNGARLLLFSDAAAGTTRAMIASADGSSVAPLPSKSVAATAYTSFCAAAATLLVAALPGGTTLVQVTTSAVFTLQCSSSSGSGSSDTPTILCSEVWSADTTTAITHAASDRALTAIAAGTSIAVLQAQSASGSAAMPATRGAAATVTKVATMEAHGEIAALTLRGHAVCAAVWGSDDLAVAHIPDGCNAHAVMPMARVHLPWPNVTGKSDRYMHTKGAIDDNGSGSDSSVSIAGTTEMSDGGSNSSSSSSSENSNNGRVSLRGADKASNCSSANPRSAVNAIGPRAQARSLALVNFGSSAALSPAQLVVGLANGTVCVYNWDGHGMPRPLMRWQVGMEPLTLHACAYSSGGGDGGDGGHGNTQRHCIVCVNGSRDAVLQSRGDGTIVCMSVCSDDDGHRRRSLVPLTPHAAAIAPPSFLHDTLAFMWLQPPCKGAAVGSGALDLVFGQLSFDAAIRWRQAHPFAPCETAVGLGRTPGSGHFIVASNVSACHAGGHNPYGHIASHNCSCCGTSNSASDQDACGRGGPRPSSNMLRAYDARSLEQLCRCAALRGAAAWSHYLHRSLARGQRAFCRPCGPWTAHIRRAARSDNVAPFAIALKCITSGRSANGSGDITPADTQAPQP